MSDCTRTARQRVRQMLIHGPRPSVARLAMARLLDELPEAEAPEASLELWWSPLHLGAELDPLEDRHWRADCADQPLAPLRGVLGTIEISREFEGEHTHRVELGGWQFEARPNQDYRRALLVQAWPLTREEAPCSAP